MHSSPSVFKSSEVEGLTQLYSELTGVLESAIVVPSAFQQVTVNGKVLGAHKSRSSSSSTVMVVTNSSSEERPARINYFAKHTASINNVQHTFLLFRASWYKPHRDKVAFGKPITIWENDIFEIPSKYSVVPVQFIKSRTVSLVDKLSNGENVLLVCPCVDF